MKSFVCFWSQIQRENTQSPAMQAVMKQETLPAIRDVRPQLEMSTRLSGAMAAGKTTTVC